MNQQRDIVNQLGKMRDQISGVSIDEETANLLMLRPPKKDGQAPWFEHAMQLRAGANQLAGTLGNREFEKSKTLLVALANQCNRCHQTFRVPVEIAPFVDPPPPAAKSSNTAWPALDFVVARQ